jgi:hypothetical protein
MDLNKIKSAILNQLTNTNGLYSLKLQNHIYGCFIIMEDLAEDTVTLSDMVLSTTKYRFDLDKQFNMIGIRFGFVMDTHLLLDRFSPEYHDLWIELFKHVYSTKDLTEIDKIEDSIIEIVQGVFKYDNDAFFIHALETGSLPQEWIEKVLGLINIAATNQGATNQGATNQDATNPVVQDSNVMNSTVIDSYLMNMPIKCTPPKTPDTALEKTDSDEEVQTNAITKALIEKPAIRVSRRLTTTRRARVKTDTKKKNLSKTRRR